MLQFKLHVHEIALIKHCLLISAKFIDDELDHHTGLLLSETLQQNSMINSKGYKTIAIDSKDIAILRDYLLIAILAINSTKAKDTAIINEIIYLLQYLKD